MVAAMVDFVDGVNHGSAGGDAWAVLRDWLKVDSADGGVSGAGAAPGAADGDDPASRSGVVQGQFADGGGLAAPGAEADAAVSAAWSGLAAPGAEADAAVSAAWSALASQQEEMEAQRILKSFRLDRAGREVARKNVLNWARPGSLSWQGWRQCRELAGLFPSLVALSALPTSSGNADPGPVAVARETLGRTVVGALWRSVEAAEAAEAAEAVSGGAAGQEGVAAEVARGVRRGDAAEVARRVAFAVAEQAPSAGDPGRFMAESVPLTAGLASAFVDQTLAAVMARAPELAAVVGPECQKVLWDLSSLRRPRNKRRTVRAAWTKAVVDFVNGVNDGVGDEVGDEVWAVLRAWLSVDSADVGVSGVAAVPGAEGRTDTAEGRTDTAEGRTDTATVSGYRR